MDVVGLVLAGGRERRLSPARPDALCELDGLPLVAHAVRTLTSAADAAEVDGGGGEVVNVTTVVVCVPDGTGARVRRVLADAVPRQHTLVVEGDPDQPAVRATCRVADVVLVHDVRRPLAPPEVVQRVLSAVRAGADAAVPVVEVTETVKQVDADGWIVRTVPRDALCQVQAPRAVRPAALRDGPGWPCAVTPAADVVTVTGHSDAFGLGAPADLELATAILRARRRK